MVFTSACLISALQTCARQKSFRITHSPATGSSSSSLSSWVQAWVWPYHPPKLARQRSAVHNLSQGLERSCKAAAGKAAAAGQSAGAAGGGGQKQQEEQKHSALASLDSAQQLMSNSGINTNASSSSGIDILARLQRVVASLSTIAAVAQQLYRYVCSSSSNRCKRDQLNNSCTGVATLSIAVPSGAHAGSIERSAAAAGLGDEPHDRVHLGYTFLCFCLFARL